MTTAEIVMAVAMAAVEAMMHIYGARVTIPKPVTAHCERLARWANREGNRQRRERYEYQLSQIPEPFHCDASLSPLHP